jgi:hypothetical protein
MEIVSDHHLVPITLKRLLGFGYQNRLISFELGKSIGQMTG